MAGIINPVPEGKISQTFNEKSYGASALGQNHIHGALDLAAPAGTPIIAPEDGFIFAQAAQRPPEEALLKLQKGSSRYWVKTPSGIFGYPSWTFANYFLDMYGGVTFLESLDKEHTHVFCHQYPNQIFNKIFKDKSVIWYEQAEIVRYPITMVATKDKVQVKKGAVIGFIGLEGLQFGAHLHWEVHKGLNNCQPYEKRLDPEKLLTEKA
jgi:hypothetical protein